MLVKIPNNPIKSRMFISYWRGRTARVVSKATWYCPKDKSATWKFLPKASSYVFFSQSQHNFFFSGWSKKQGATSGWSRWRTSPSWSWPTNSTRLNSQPRLIRSAWTFWCYLVFWCTAESEMYWLWWNGILWCSQYTHKHLGIEFITIPMKTIAPSSVWSGL